MTARLAMFPEATGLQAGCRSGGASLRESSAASTPRGVQARSLRSGRALAGVEESLLRKQLK